MISPLNDPSAQMAYQIALNNVSNGYIGDLEKLVLSTSPLPNDFIDGFISQSVEVKSMMELTNSTLSVWIEEAKKANYFHKHFTDLSRMINSGVQSMARGLVTLHALGEDLDQSPMSIDDLIGVGSYHFNKSALGVLQTSAKNPETGFRLLANQLQWQNTLLRLFKTKEMLAKGAGDLGLGARDRCQVSGSRFEKVNGCTASEVKALPDSGKDVEAFEPFGTDEVPAFSGVSGFSAPAAYAAPRAFTALGGRCSVVSGQKVEGSTDSDVSEKAKAEKTGTKITKKIKNEEKIEKQETREKTEEIENQNEIPEDLNEGNKEDEIPEDELDEANVSENSVNDFSEEAAEMNDEISPENSESEIQNDEVDEGQDSDMAEFSKRDGSGVTVPFLY